MSFADVLDAKPKEPELYRVLGCDESSSIDQITAEYRARVREFHPDKQKNEDLTEKFVELQHAYDILAKESSRKSYDSWLHSPFPVTFDEFLRSQDKFLVSTHWAHPKSQPSIAMLIPEKSMESNRFLAEIPKSSRWSESDRYQSSIASAFRNYKL